MIDPLEQVFDAFADVTEAQVLQMREEIRAVVARCDAAIAESTAREAALRSTVETLQRAFDDLSTQVRSAPVVEVREGPPGRDGKDAEVSDDHLRTLIREVMPPPLPGAPGRDGSDGKDGHDGSDGATGPAGSKGEQGDRGLSGTDGTAGSVGPTGPQGERGEGVVGPTGPQGERGLPGSDSTVPGPQGERGTDGIATRAEIEEVVEERTRDIHVRSIVDVYREVYVVGEHYRRGDMATWDGSLFLALEAIVPGERPMESPKWRQITKKGRDGRDRK